MEPRETQRTFTEVLGDFAAGLQYEALPAEVTGKTKMLFLDSIGVALAAQKLEYSTILNNVLTSLGGKPQSTVIGRRGKSPTPVAAFANGSMIHGLDFDDTHLYAVLHPSSFILPAALAVAEERKSKGEEVITAAVAGYEVACRMGMAASGKFHHRGFHPTSIIGSFGSAVTAGKLLGLNSHQLATAMGITGSLHGAGLQEFLNDGTWTKRLHPGWAAYSGIIAALLARDGFTGPHRILEGKYGLFNSYLGPNQFEGETLVRGLGEIWETLRISFKLYPSCYATHIYMDSALSLKHKYGISPDDIASIHVRVSDFDEKLVIGKDVAKYRPPTPYAAQFSLPYCLALAFKCDAIGLDKFSEERIRNEGILSVAQKVSYTVDPEVDPQVLCGHVSVKTKDDKVYENIERFLRGSPEKPVEDEVIKDKFRLNTQGLCSKVKQGKIINTVLALDRLEGVAPLMRLLRS